MEFLFCNCINSGILVLLTLYYNIYTSQNRVKQLLSDY